MGPRTGGVLVLYRRGHEGERLAMMGVAEIKQAIRSLTPDEVAEVAEWLQDLNVDQSEDEWDRQIEADAAAGRLDVLKERVDRARAAGTLRDL